MILFVCTQARCRSRTAEMLCIAAGLDARCAGTGADAVVPVSKRMIELADLIVCMEGHHSMALDEEFQLPHDRVVVLNIPDLYEPLDPVLVGLLIERCAALAPDLVPALEKGAKVLAEPIAATKTTRYATKGGGLW